MNLSIEEQLLQRARDNLIRIIDDVEIEYFHHSHRKWKRKKPDQHPKSGRYRFRFGPKRLTVYRNRLIWIITTKTLIPDDHVIDHIDGNREDDRFDNLRLMRYIDSQRQGYEVRTRDGYRECCDFFDGMTF